MSTSRWTKSGTSRRHRYMSGRLIWSMGLWHSGARTTSMFPLAIETNSLLYVNGVPNEVGFQYLFLITLIDKIRRVSALAANHDCAAWWFAAVTFELRINGWLQMRWVSCFLLEVAFSYRLRSRSGNGWTLRKQESTAGEWIVFSVRIMTPRHYIRNAVACWLQCLCAILQS